MNPQQREITEEEWIAASQAYCGAGSDGEGRPADGPAPRPTAFTGPVPTVAGQLTPAETVSPACALDTIQQSRVILE